MLSKPHNRVWLWVIAHGVLVSSVLTILLVGMLLEQGKLAEVVYAFPAEQSQVRKASVYIHTSSLLPVSLGEKRPAHNRKQEVRGVVVPHHIVASDLINETLDRVAARDGSVKHIILLAPNHDDVGPVVAMSDGDWQTENGMMGVNGPMVGPLVENNVVSVDRGLLNGEHGVFTLVPFLHHYFSEATITPIILRESVTPEQLSALATFIDARATKDTLVVVSADFSHYLPELVADFQDDTSLSALRGAQPEDMQDIAVDATPALSVLMKYLAMQESQRFVFVGDDNSANIMEDETLEETTSYITGYYVGGEPADDKSLTLLSVGDMMLDRAVYTHTLRAGDFNHPFQFLDRFFDGAHLTYGNLEGPVTTFRSVSNNPANSFQFTFDTRYVEPLSRYFDIVSLANNHTHNFGNAGLEQSREFLAEGGIDAFGGPYNETEHLSFVTEKNGISLGFVGYHQLIGYGFDDVLAEVKRLDPLVDVVIVAPHWGAEYKTERPGVREQREARQLVDVGADLILGAHPHVIQPIEEYKGKMIFYSLGNFIFDQYWSINTQRGLVVGTTFRKIDGNVQSEYRLFPVAINGKSQPSLAPHDMRESILKKLSMVSIGSEERKEQIASGHLK